MFQPETEDMLPRMAPKPSSNIPNGESEGIIKPQVPEVSILFGQQNDNLQQCVFDSIPKYQQNTNVPQQTYASWKKQMLPKVSYPSPADIADKQLKEIRMHNLNSERTNLYPLRANNNPKNNVGANTDSFDICNGGVDRVRYRRSLESCNNFYQLVPTSQQHHPLGAQINLPNGGSGEVLTICAGTQTDALLVSTNNYSLHVQSESCPSFALKKDIEDIRQILDELKAEQQHMSKMLETILLSHHYQEPMKSHCRDIGIQVHFTAIDSSQNVYIRGGIGQDQPVPKNKFLEHLKPAAHVLQTPKGKPIAQSTTYKLSSPSATCQQSSGKPTYEAPKSSSDTSLAMNELALKYLPNEKLAELLKELNMNCPLEAQVMNMQTTDCGANTEKFDKEPSDISNASYKYLKKYRLLPEEHEDGNILHNRSDGVIKNGNDNQMPHYNSPHCNVPNTAINQNATLTNRCSPYAGRLPLSPLARDPSPQQTTAAQHIVNLENIKHQPKFL